MQWERSRLRRGAVVAGVIVFHVVVITEVARWRGWLPVVGEGLIKVSIFADTPAVQGSALPRRGLPVQAKPAQPRG